ncbi:hypothetical protein BCV70DRAFT_111902 [Testicularia cyperi]|uniref:Uncharacterized protein n=1 Tax=Testicularia cyperi TaxID=1882483 RepID=A0A317XPF7_9BASI|nr:hypothetical protein BCV70DRAFT_111902 [Testicularia cyperi]
MAQIMQANTRLGIQHCWSARRTMCKAEVSRPPFVGDGSASVSACPGLPGLCLAGWLLPCFKVLDPLCRRRPAVRVKPLLWPSVHPFPLLFLVGASMRLAFARFSSSTTHSSPFPSERIATQLDQSQTGSISLSSEI